MRTGHLEGRIVEISFWALTSLVVAMMAGVFALYSRAPVDGFFKEGRWNQRLTVTGTMLPEARGLQPGDKVLSVDKVALSHRRVIGPSSLLGHIKSPPGSAQYEIERGGNVMQVEVPLHVIGWKRLLLFGGPHFLLASFFIVIASALFLRSGYARGGSSRKLSQYRTVRVICYALAFGAGNIVLSTDLSMKSGAGWLGLLHLAMPITSGFAYGLFLHFFLSFPPREDIFARKRWAIYVLHGSYLSLPIAATIFILMGRQTPWLLTEARLALIGLFIITSIVVAFRSYRRTESSVERNQMRWLAWGATVGVGPWFFLYLIFALVGIRPPVDHRILLLCLAAIPISLLVAISRHRLLEIDGLIRRSLVYTVVMAAMAGAYLMAYGASFWVIEIVGGDVKPVEAAIVSAMLVALGFNPLKVVSERLVARMFYRGWVNTREAFSQLSEDLNQVITLPQLAGLLTTKVPRAFAASGAALIVIDGEKRSHLFASNESLYNLAADQSSRIVGEISARPECWSSVLYPEVEDEDPGPVTLIAGASLCLPMSVGGKLAGIYLLGEKLSNRLYAVDELETLRTLANHAAAALEHASAYQRLNDLNAELESLVELRTEQLQQANVEMGHKNTDLVRQNAELARVINVLRETQAALVEAERRAAIGEIVITVCHEINNPLTAIMGNTQLIELRAKSIPQEILERVRVIDQCAVTIKDITEKMRRLKKADTIIYAGQEKMIDIRREEAS
jgi:GAF domain-containing protein